MEDDSPDGEQGEPLKRWLRRLWETLTCVWLLEDAALTGGCHGDGTHIDGAGRLRWDGGVGHPAHMGVQQVDGE